jgi:hypothetical protein
VLLGGGEVVGAAHVCGADASVHAMSCRMSLVGVGGQCAVEDVLSCDVSAGSALAGGVAWGYWMHPSRTETIASFSDGVTDSP